METDDIGNVYGRLPSAGLRAPVLVTAHTDTVFPPDTDLAIRREAGRVYGPGLGDNALGVAALMELPALLQSADVELPGDLWLVAKVGEEGLGDLRGMRRAVDRLGETVGATIVLEGLAFGRIYNSGIGVRRYCVRASAPGGHAWMHFGRPSAVHGLVQLGSALTELQTPAAPRTTFNIGKISGGTSVNTIARTAELELDLRSEDDAILAKLARKVETTIAAVEERSKVKFKFEICGNRPSGQIPPEHPLVQLAVATLQHVGHAEPQLERGSTDANIPLSRGLPAVTVGLTSGGNTHRPDEYLEVELLQDGLRHIFLLVAGAFRISP